MMMLVPPFLTLLSLVLVSSSTKMLLLQLLLSSRYKPFRFHLHRAFFLNSVPPSQLATTFVTSDCRTELQHRKTNTRRENTSTRSKVDTRKLVCLPNFVKLRLGDKNCRKTLAHTWLPPFPRLAGRRRRWSSRSGSCSSFVDESAGLHSKARSARQAGRRRCDECLIAPRGLVEF